MQDSSRHSTIKQVLKRYLPEDWLAAYRDRRTKYKDRVIRRRRRRRRLERASRQDAGIELLQVQGFDLAYRLDSSDEDVIVHSFDNDFFIRAMPDYIIPSTAIILDVGAHIGTFSLLVARSAAQGRVFSIEASRNTFNLLRINVALNGLTNIRAEHLALGAGAGIVRLYHSVDGNWGHSMMKKMSDHHEPVQSMGLPEYMKTRAIDRIDLAKFNCEGAEFPILLSSPLDVLRRIDRIMVAYHCDLVDPQLLGCLRSHLVEAGFSIESKDATAKAGWIIAKQQTLMQCNANRICPD